MYESSKDRALLLSQKLHEDLRIGQPLFIIEGIDTVDASNVDTDFLGHSYFSEALKLLTDINSILIDNKAPKDRVLLSTKTLGKSTYYEFKLS
jgi:Alpha/beta hydrolase of unknown function (DUF900)